MICFRIVIFSIFSFVWTGTYSQKTEIGIFGGLANYAGELTSKRFNPEEINGAGGIFFRHHFHPRFSARAGLNYGVVSESDAHSSIDYRKIRNLSFRSHILEFALIPEFNIVKYRPYSNQIIPYVFAGIGIFHFDPKAELDGEWIRLQPLGTEGQGLEAYPGKEKYKLIEYSFPAGAGIRLTRGSMSVALETGLRYTTTDYLDDVSTTYIDPKFFNGENDNLAFRLSNRTGEILGTPLALDHNDMRGNPATNDWYAFSGIRISYLFLPDENRGLIHCPKF